MPESLLLVDDDAMTLNILTRLLTSDGYSTECYASGAAALEQLRARRFALLLTDYMMPDMQGTALVTEAMALYPTMPCILMSGHERPLDFPDDIPWLTKPLSTDVLLDTVATALQTVRASARDAPDGSECSE